MALYWFCLVLHFLALSLWLGHMLVWAAFVGPAGKALAPPAMAAAVRRASLWIGGLGWPALAVLIPTGLYMLSVRGIGLAELASGEAFAVAGGGALAIKLAAVAFMMLYQVVFGHRPAALAIWSNIAAALVVLGTSAAFVRGIG